MKKILLIAVIIVAGLTIIKKISPQNEKLIKDVKQQTSILDVSASDWVKGKSEGVTTLIEYSDLQCPACGLYFPVLKRLNDEFGEQMRFVYRHFPLTQIHKNAELAARATEASGLQGKFWEMHDLLFMRQDEWSQGDARKLLGDYAKELGLDLEKFLKDLDSSEVNSAVKADYNSGLILKVNTTPTFFLNGKRITNPRNYDEFRDIILGELSKTK